MRAGEIFAQYSAALARGDLEGVAALLHDDFRQEGAELDGVGRAEFLEALRVRFTAFPDYSENPSDIEEVGDDVVQFTTNISGTQTGVLSLPGLAPIPPTGRIVRLPRVPAWLHVLDDKMLVYHVAPVPGSGVKGIVAQLKG